MAPHWDDSLKVGVDVMDEDHRALFVLLQHFDGADDADTAGHFGALIEHLAEHFDRENALMRRHNFFATHCHEDEHKAVLAQLRGLHAKALTGDVTPIRAYIDRAIGPWFLNHRNTMDWVTAQFLQSHAVPSSATLA
jgi:hemerythrin